MALTAKFIADFSSFQSAVQKAEVSLKGFETGAGKVESSLNKMANSLSGTKLIQDANLMAAAVEKIGGPTKLTANELQNVGAKAQEAVAKMNRMGIEVPPGLQKIADTAKGPVTSAFAQLGQMVVATFTVGAIVRWGQSLLKAGDDIKKMSDQTGLSTTEVQKLNFVAGQSGSSIGSLVGAVQNLQQRLGDENSGAAGAMAKLGIQADAFNKLSTYDQMTALAGAIRDIKDPTEQASVAAAIFGKSWKEILPAIKSGMKEVGDQAPIMADSTVESLDRVGDALTRAKQQATVWGAGIVVAIENAGFAFGDFLSKFNPEHFGVATSQILRLQARFEDKDGLKGALQSVKPAALATMEGIKGVGMSSDEASKWVKKLDTQIKDSIDSNKKAATASREHKQELDKKREALEKEAAAYTALVMPTRDVVFLQRDINAAIQQTAVGSLPQIIARMNDFTKATIATEAELRKIGTTVHEVDREFEESFGSKLNNSLGDIATILDSIPGKFAEIGAMAARAGQAIMKNLAEGNVWGAIIAGATAAIGILGKLFGFGKSAAEKAFQETKKLRDDYINSFAGGFAELQRKAADAGVTLNAIWNAKTVEAYKKAVEDVTKAIEFQDHAMQVLDDTVAKYGFTIEELGPKFGQQKLHQQAMALLQDYEVLTAAGIDHNTIIQKMGPSLQEYVTTALKAGLAIPEHLRPVLQSMIDLGLLTDENGEALTDLEDLTFAETLDAKFRTLIDSINDLIEAITRGLTPALEDIPSVPNPFADWPSELPNYGGGGGGGDTGNYGSTGGLVTDSGIQFFRRGGRVLPFRGSDTVPAMLTPGELVLTKAQQVSLLQGGPSQAAVVTELRAIHIENQALRQQMAERDRALPKMIRDAILLAAS